VHGDLRERLGFWSFLRYELVNSYPQTKTNYEKAVAALKDHYGKTDLLPQVYVREPLKLVIMNAMGKEEMLLSSLYLKLESHLRSLASLNLSQTDPSNWLYIIL
jgi:hypothetical protein